MGDDGFYITLPSNASGKIFPQNTSSSFTVQLVRPLDLRGEWEAGLVEIQYPNNWFTLPTQSTFRIADETDTWEYHMRTGYFDDIRHLAEHMNYVIEKQAENPPNLRFFYDNLIGKIRYHGAVIYTVTVSEDLAYLVGAPANTPVKKFQYGADITGGFNSLYLYTDIIEHQIVGDTAVPLLRCVPIQGKTHEFITITYDKPHYLPLSKHHIETITVEIKTDQNRYVPFRYGKVIVRLHLRPRKRW